MDTKKIKRRIVTLADWKPSERQLYLVQKVLKSGRLTYGPYTKKVEQMMAQKHNFKYAIFVNSGTSALQIAWHYLKKINKWKDGSEVIVPAITFVATINVLLQNKLKPILVDIDPDTFNINPQLIEKAITKKTVAICPVDLLGRPCDIMPIKKLAKRYKLKIVEDACETMFVDHSVLGKAFPVGSGADIACYSSYLAHIISTGVGGFICTNSKKAQEYMRSMIWHGRDKMYMSMDHNLNITDKLLRARYRFDKPGYSYRLTEIEAAIGVDEIERSNEIIVARRSNAIQLGYLLKGINEIILPTFTFENAWMFFPIVCDKKIDRDKLCLFLEKKGIQTRYIMPLINQPIFKGMWNPKDYPKAARIDKKGFLVGVHHFLKDKDLKYVAKCFKEYFKI